MNPFEFKSKKGEVLNHWISFADGFAFPPLDFYKALEDQLVLRQIPKMNISRVEFGEGGILSAKRIYLRMVRERLAFDACAAPFGNIYFFSCRTVYIPTVVKIWHLVVILLFFSFACALLIPLLGFLYAVVATVGLAVAIAQIFQNAILSEVGDIDAALMKIAIIGPLYERLFRKETYYREDTRILYLKVLPDLVKELAREITASKGVKLRDEYTRSPILGELYKRAPRESDAETPQT